MSEPTPVIISGAVESPVDETVLRRLVEEAGAMLGPVHGKNGKSHLKERINGYNQAAQLSPWVVLVDLDDDAECAPPLCAEWLPDPVPMMCFRVVVRELEAWLIADREHLARFLSISAARVPRDPEAVADPKRAVVELAKHSRRRDIREDMVPRPQSGRIVGPAYTSRLIEFINTSWRPEVAARRSDSLRRCAERIRALVGGEE